MNQPNSRPGIIDKHYEEIATFSEFFKFGIFPEVKTLKLPKKKKKRRQTNPPPKKAKECRQNRTFHIPFLK